MEQRQNKAAAVSRRLRAAACVTLLLAVICLAMFGISRYRQHAQERREDGLRSLYEETISEKSGLSILSGAKAEAFVTKPFSELFELNPDIVGWIKAGADISDPVVYRDNEYYLDHDFYGESSAAGTVFADEENPDWINEPYVLIYGHNMKNDTMFGTLDHYLEKDYLAENSQVQFHWIGEEQPRDYVPFAMMDISVDAQDSGYFWLRRYDLFDPEGQVDPERYAVGVQSFITEIRQNAQWDIPEIDVNETDAILGLVTCGYDYDNGRLILFCRALREGETAEQMTEIIRQSIGAL